MHGLSKVSAKSAKELSVDIEEEQDLPERQYQIYQYSDGSCELMEVRSGMSPVDAHRLSLSGNILTIAARRLQARGK